MRPVMPNTATDLQNLLRKTGKPNTASTFVGPTQTHGTATPADSEGNPVDVERINSTRIIPVRDDALLVVLGEILNELQALREAQEGD